MTSDDTHDRTTKRRPGWFDREDLWQASYPFFFSDAKFDQAIKDVDRVLRLADSPAPKVLDLCCGAGRFSVPLAQRGLRVTGVDRTKYLLEKARLRARAADATIEWVESDMRDFVRPEAYDLALSMFTSFGYFDDQADDAQVLANVMTSLKPGGRFVVETFGKELIAARFSDTGTYRLDDGSVLFENRRIIDDWTRIHNDWTLVSGGGVQTFSFTVRVYSGRELHDSMIQAGFDDVALFGDFEGAPYDRNASRLIAVGKKAA